MIEDHPGFWESDSYQNHGDPRLEEKWLELGCN
jgi:hypothetical protein